MLTYLYSLVHRVRDLCWREFGFDKTNKREVSTGLNLVS